MARVPAARAAAMPGSKSVIRPDGPRSGVYTVWTCATAPPHSRHARLALRKFPTAASACGTCSQLPAPKPNWQSMLSRTVVSGVTG